MNEWWTGYGTSNVTFWQNTTSNNGAVYVDTQTSGVTVTWFDNGDDDSLGGVREPRRPLVSPPSSTFALPLPHE